MPAPAQDFLGAVVSLHPPIKTKPKVRPSPQNGQLPGFQTIQESQPYRIEPQTDKQGDDAWPKRETV
jgi:hypothetical protein